MRPIKPPTTCSIYQDFYTKDTNVYFKSVCLDKYTRQGIKAAADAATTLGMRLYNLSSFDISGKNGQTPSGIFEFLKNKFFYNNEIYVANHEKVNCTKLVYDVSFFGHITGTDDCNQNDLAAYEFINGEGEI